MHFLWSSLEHKGQVVHIQSFHLQPDGCGRRCTLGLHEPKGVGRGMANELVANFALVSGGSVKRIPSGSFVDSYITTEI